MFFKIAKYNLFIFKNIVNDDPNILNSVLCFICKLLINDKIFYDFYRDAMFLFLLVLLVNLKKASLLAQFALSGCSQTEVVNNISKGMSLLGPSFSLDSIVCSLVISVGMLSGVQRLETLCLFTCASFIVNYVVMMSFYPACLSLVLDVSFFLT